MFYIYRLSLIAIALTVVFSTSLLAQNSSSDLTKEELLHALEVDNHRKTKSAEVAAKYGDPCEMDWDFTFEQVKVQGYSLIRVVSSMVGQSFVIAEESGKEISKGNVLAEPSVYRIPLNANFHLIVTDKCGDKVIAASFSSKTKGANDPLDLNLNSYTAISIWQKSSSTIHDFLNDYQGIDFFSKASLLQELYYKGQPYSDKVLSFDRIPRNEDLLNDKSFVVDDCQCSSVRLSMNYSLDPYQRVRSDGRISGDYGSRTDRRFRGGDIRTDQYWAFEGPSRYQEMFAKTLRCVNAPYDFFWNRDGIVDDSEEEVFPLDFTSTIEYSWICIGNNGAPSDCGCDRTVFFEWDYESVVKANAEIINGGHFVEVTVTLEP